MRKLNGRTENAAVLFMKAEMNKKILMLCYYYPPLADVGSKRSIAFSKYFKKYGWTPSVLSVKNPDKSYCSPGNEKPPEGITVKYSYSIIHLYRPVVLLNIALSKLLRAMKINLKRNYFRLLLCIPDHFWGWIPLTAIKGLRLIKELKIDLIYVSSTPVSSVFTAVWLKWMTGKPLIVDFRDPFAVEILFSIRDVPKFRRRIDRGIQKYFLRHTDIFIVNNDETKNIYIQEYPEVKDKIFAVHNGFEAEYLPQERLEKEGKFTIIYAGEFYFWALTSTIFFEAVALLKKRGEIDKETFQFLFYGDDKDRIKRLAIEWGIEDLVVVSFKVPYRTVLDRILKSHLQLLRIVKPMISTKLFEGIPLNVPFLATIPSGEVKEIITTYSPSSYVVTDESAEKVADAILDAMSKYRKNEIKDNHVEAFLKNFSRENLTLKLMKIIEQNLIERRQKKE
jgi:glycosyltransferase involved in cell wall biosynthesis